MLEKLKPKSEFSRNVLTLMTGTTIAQAIPIAISPILTRIYTPEDFGVFALFIAIVSIFGSIANGRYELAIMLPKKDEDAINIFALGFIITTIMSLFLFIIILLFHDYFVEISTNKEIEVWLYFVPIVVFFIGLFNILNYFNNRQKQYEDIAKATIIKSTVSAVIQLSIGFVKQGVTGLITGQIISHFFANMKLLKNIIRDKILISKISKVKIFALAKRYQRFPKISMWAGLINILSLQLTNILISIFFNVGTLGLYSLVQRIFGIPTLLISTSIGKVFFQEATAEMHRTGKSTKSFNNTIKNLFIIAIPIFSFLFFIVEDLFSLVFGEEWRIAGTYAKAIMPLFFIKFIVSPFTLIAIIFEKVNIDLFFQIGLLLLYIIIFNIKVDSFVGLLYLMDFVIVPYYLFYWFIMKNIAQGKRIDNVLLYNKEIKK